MLREYEGKGIIEYKGVSKNMIDVYKNSSCIVLPTYYAEGMSNVLLESCATGRPVITTDRSGCREVVENGVNGFLIKQKNTEDLINKIELFLSLPVFERKKMGIEGRRIVEKKFDRSIVIKKYIQIIKDFE